jgi:hypothetical protein
MEEWEGRFDRMHTPNSSVPSHREALRQKLESANIPAGHGRRTVATLCLTALVMLGGLTLGYPSWAKDLWKTIQVQTITLHTQDGHTLMIKKMQCDPNGACPAICDTSACDSSWTTPDGRKYFRKRIQSGNCAAGQMRMAFVTSDTSRLTEFLRSGLEVAGPSGDTMRISSPDGEKTWIVNGDTIRSSDVTTATDVVPQMNPEASEFPTEPVASTKEDVAGLNSNFDLFQNYPNPFNPTTQISFDLKQSGPVTLKVYDLMGREVASLLNGNVAAGHNTVLFNGSHLPSGSYLYTLQAGGHRMSKVMILTK